MTLTSYRCVPDGGRSRPRPDRFILDAVAGLAASGPLAAVDTYGRPAARPRWLAGEYLALLERQGRGVGVIYLLHFDQPVGDLHNPRGFASHYTGKPASSGSLTAIWQVGGGEFAELGPLRCPVGVLKWVTGASAGQGASLPGRDLAHGLRVMAEGRRLRRHLVQDHGWVELADRQQNADVWAGDHRDDHHARRARRHPHDHEEGPADAC